MPIVQQTTAAACTQPHHPLTRRLTRSASRESPCGAPLDGCDMISRQSSWAAECGRGGGRRGQGKAGLAEMVSRDGGWNSDSQIAVTVSDSHAHDQAGDPLRWSQCAIDVSLRRASHRGWTANSSEQRARRIGGCGGGSGAAAAVSLCTLVATAQRNAASVVVFGVPCINCFGSPLCMAG